MTSSEYVLGVIGVLGVYGLIRFFARRKSDDHGVNWTPLESVGITLMIYFSAQIIAVLGAGLIGSSFGLTDDQMNSVLEDSPGWQFALTLSIAAMTTWLVYYFVVRVRKTALRAIGVVKPRLRDIWYALAGFVVYFSVYVLLVFTVINQLFPQIDTDQKQELGFAAGIAGPELIFVFLSLVILPPLVEELLVRGFLYTGLKTKLPFVAAALVASIVFAAAHLQWGSGKPLLWTAAADTFVLSMVLIWLRQKTGSLWPGIGVHFIKNAIAFTVLFILKVA